MSQVEIYTYEYNQNKKKWEVIEIDSKTIIGEADTMSGCKKLIQQQREIGFQGFTPKFITIPAPQWLTNINA